MMMNLHPEDEALPQSLSQGWSWEPAIVVALVVTGALYAWGWWRMRQAGAQRSVPAWQGSCFMAGWCTLVLALLSPVHRLGGFSLAMHMVQHELLMVVAAPLLVLGRPLLVFLWAFPQSTRERMGAFFRRPTPSAMWAAISGPLVVWLLHGLALWIWHAPPLYSAALHSEWVHAAQHSAFLFTALLFWWTLLHGRYGRLGYGAALVFVFTTAMHSGALGALLTVSPRVAYPDYQRTIFGMSPLEDQQLAGLIMWVPAGVILVTIGAALVLAWMAEAERRVRYSSADSIARASVLASQEAARHA
jgi:putative membrane protein